MENKLAPLPPDIASDLVRNGLPSDAFDPFITVKYNNTSYITGLLE